MVQPDFDAGANPPVVTADQTVDEIMEKAGRRHTPLRITFVQQGSRTRPEPGPLKWFVTNGDRRALLLYLLAMAKSSAKPWDTALPAPVWARALAIEPPETASAASAISKAWKRLENRKLIRRGRYKRLAHIHMLKEDGSGDPYQPPGQVGERYLRIPHTFWQTGPEGERWYRVLSLAEIAMLLIALSLRNGFRLPSESVPAWYGISADTANSGLKGLVDHGVLTVEKRYKVAPLSPRGYTADHIYTLQHPLEPTRSGPPRSPQ